MAKQVTITLSIPEPGDQLPHTVLATEDGWIGYTQGGVLQYSTSSAVIIRMLGNLPDSVPVKVEVAEP
jgi:hypothetical protein